MTAVDPTALQTARLSIGQTRVCWPMLAEARTARVSRGSVALSGRAAASRDEDLRAERADRDAAIGYRALAAEPAPVNLAVVDAELMAGEQLRELHWTLRSDLRHWGRYLRPWPGATDQRCTWLTEYLEHAGADLVDQAAKDLRQVAHTIAGAVGHQLADDWRTSGKRCPCCGQRAITIWDLSSDRREHTRECTGQTDDGRPCRCAGPDCDCGRPGARAGTRHLWPAT